MKKKSKISKVETIQEYLFRGGAISRIPSVILKSEADVTRKTTAGGPALFLSLEEADLFFGEAKKLKPKKAKPTLKINLNSLPPELRAKLISKLKEETDGEGFQEDLKEDEDADQEN